MGASAQHKITGREYSALEHAYDWFNTRLFGDTLPPCLLTLQRKAHSKGYFAQERFTHRADTHGVADELALNPDTFVGRSDKEILSTLVHEMVHCWQRHFGIPGRRGYHNREWAAQMRAIGLMPSDTGTAGGKQTGQRVTHYIVLDGLFDQAAAALLATGFCLHWQPGPLGPQQGSQRSKTKYRCPTCGQNAWAKPTASLLCGACLRTMEPQC
jgi:predicted SprT family Zn-dependent metalloprotease